MPDLVAPRRPDACGREVVRFESERTRPENGLALEASRRDVKCHANPQMIGG